MYKRISVGPLLLATPPVYDYRQRMIVKPSRPNCVKSPSPQRVGNIIRASRCVFMYRIIRAAREYVNTPPTDDSDFYD